MNEFYTFASASPWLVAFLAWLILQLLCFSINRPLRHWRILKHGWPPAHCDADGDQK